MLSCAVNTKEGRDITTVDMPGAFMQTNQEGMVHIKLEGVMVTILVKMNPDKYAK